MNKIKTEIDIKLDMEECIPKCIIPKEFFNENFPFLLVYASHFLSILLKRQTFRRRSDMHFFQKHSYKVQQ